MKTKLLYILSCVLFTSFIVAQNPVETTVDTTRIKIGDTFSYTIRVQTNKNSKVFFPESEQLGSFDVVESKAVDTIATDDVLELIKQYDLTSFDEGSFTVPQLPIIIDANQFKTDSIAVNVTGVAVDTLKTPLYDIKNISTTGASFSSNWFYVIFAVISLLIGLGLYLFIKKRQEKNLTEEDKYKTPYEKAVKKLKKLEEKKNWVKDNPKEYYSNMTDITRSFLEDTFDISAHELTTFQIISILNSTLKDNEIKIDPVVIKEFKRILETADLVKFAKSQPSEQEVTNDTNKTQTIINDINIAYPISAATQTERIRLREERKRKRLRLRIWMPIATTLGLLIIAGIVYLINTSAERDWHLLTFDSTKKLMKKEWITSQYGSNPGITVSTPEVLFRRNNPAIQTTMPEGVTTIQQFSTGMFHDPLFITLGTIDTNKDFKYTDKEMIDHSLQLLTQNFKARDIDYKTSDFENANGLTGLKIKGNFNYSNPINKKEENVIFEGVVSTNKSHKDLVWVFYLDTDEIAPKLAERVFDSMQYNQETE